MTEEERKKLVELRKKRQQEKELESNLLLDLIAEEKKNVAAAIRKKQENAYVEYLMIFLVTLSVLYTFFFLVSYIFMGIAGVMIRQLEIDLSWSIPIMHLLIWSLTIWSVWRKKSILDDIVDFFA